MSEAELVYSPQSELPNGSEKCDCDQMLQDSSYDLHKPRIGGMLFPQFPSLVRDCRELQARPLKSPKDLALLSSGVVPNERVWSGYIQEKCGIEEKLGHSIDARDYRFDLGKGLVSSEVSTISLPKEKCDTTDKISCVSRLNKFVRRLYDMLCGEKSSGVVQWRRGLLILLDTKLFAKQILPKYFNTRNFKTFRRQLNYYGFVHVRSYSNTGTKSTTALWVNQELATGNVEGQKNRLDLDSVASVLYLKRVEPCDSVKTSEGRRVRKELAMTTIEGDLGVSPQTLQLQQLYVLSEEYANDESREPLITSALQRRVDLPFVEHHNWSHMATTAVPVCQLQKGSSPTPGKGCCRFDSSNTDDSVAKPPTSSASVANLLLLLSSG